MSFQDRKKKKKIKQIQIASIFHTGEFFETFSVPGNKCWPDNGFPIQLCKINQFICCNPSFLMKNRNTRAPKDEFCSAGGE